MNPEIMGGEPVFPGSRLTVRRMGGLLERGEAPHVILDDYSKLTREDLELARLYVKSTRVSSSRGPRDGGGSSRGEEDAS
jgi:uncharacterized protein (DUF433 family)